MWSEELEMQLVLCIKFKLKNGNSVSVFYIGTYFCQLVPLNVGRISK